jgi:hypothetical protein
MSQKTFAAVESVDNPKGAMLVRYQVVERIEPDPEEGRVAQAAVDEHLADMPEELREALISQVRAMQAMHGQPQISYRIESKNMICKTAEEVTAAILEAREADEEIRRLTRSGARFEHAPYRGMSL